MAVTTPSKHQPLPVIGEAYEVEEHHLHNCDRLEGHPNWYKRQMINVSISGRDEEVFIYEMPEHPSHNQLCSIIDNMYYKWVG
jgi:gamma-glutamylcyclotransferase (GGCT)/AIG2-like uncharacterized protein YtfP